MSLSKIDRPVFLYDSDSDLADIPGGIKKGTIYVNVGSPAVSVCFDGTTLTEIATAADISSAASQITFDDTVAELGASNVQDAIVALKALIDAL